MRSSSVHRISQMHHARVSGSGLCHGCSTRHVWPTAAMPCLKANDHQHWGSCAPSWPCWLIVKQSNQKYEAPAAGARYFRYDGKAHTSGGRPAPFRG